MKTTSLFFLLLFFSFSIIASEEEGGRHPADPGALLSPESTACQNHINSIGGHLVKEGKITSDEFSEVLTLFATLGSTAISSLFQSIPKDSPNPQNIDHLVDLWAKINKIVQKNK